ncbi:MAG: hypothetical protein NWP98_07155 [Erythrobacter sp.]|nr:hypothetical protein [Erythrobacter sp.]
MEFAAVFMWACLGLFLAAGAIWLLDMAGALTIRSPAQRTMLNAALGTTLLGGMASFAVATFFPPPPSTPEPAKQPEPATPIAPPAGPVPTPPGGEGATPAPSSTNTAAPGATPSPQVPPAPSQTACRLAAHPPRLAEWANATLSTPPSFRCAITAPYPACVAELRERDVAEISREAARACGADVINFRRSHISSAYAAKLTYQDNLDAAEASLRIPRNVEEEDRRDYVVAEIARMNGQAWRDFTALDQRSKLDMLLCQTDAKRCLADE